MSRATHDQYGIDLNTALVGEGNTVDVRMIPYLEAFGSSLDVGTIEYTAEVQSSTSWETHGGVPVEGAKITEAEVDSVYERWSKRAQKKWDTYRSTVERGALDSMRAWASRHPMTISTTFDNKRGPDFSRIFEEAPRLPDTPATRERLRNYAMHLRDLMAEKDTAALVEEFRPAIEYAYRQGKREGESLQEFVAMYRKKLVLDGAEKELDFSRSEVRLSQWSDGRVWQLRRDGAEGLLRRIKVYVAELDGELKVVR
jgi:hypothetical protein